MAMTAIWLATVAPVISQTVAIDSMSTMALDCDGHHDHAPPLAPHPSSSMEKCGYCGLLSHHPVLVASTVPAAVAPQPAALGLPRCTVRATEPPVLAAASRGPPVSSLS